MNKLTDPHDPRITESVRRRFWARVDQSAGPEACWPWTGHKLSKKNYGIIRLDDSTQMYAHRMSLLLSGRAFSGGRSLCLHSCDNPICVNPGHLRPGSALENSADMVQRSRQGKRGAGTGMIGEKCWNHRLTTESVAQIKAEYRPYIVTMKMLAERHGVSLSTIGAVLCGQNWKHLCDDVQRDRRKKAA